MGNDRELAPVRSQPRKTGTQRAAHPGLRSLQLGPQLALGPEQDAETPDCGYLQHGLMYHWGH